MLELLEHDDRVAAAADDELPRGAVLDHFRLRRALLREEPLEGGDVRRV